MRQGAKCQNCQWCKPLAFSAYCKADDELRNIPGYLPAISLLSKMPSQTAQATLDECLRVEVDLDLAQDRLTPSAPPTWCSGFNAKESCVRSN